MIRCTIALLGTLVAALCGCASHQRSAWGGISDHTRNFLTSWTYPVPHGQMFSMTAAALQAEGYTVDTRDSAETKGFLVTQPRFTPFVCLDAPSRTDAERLGLGVVVYAATKSRHDSTEVRVMTEVIRRNPIAASERDRADTLDFGLRVCGTGRVVARVDSLAGRVR
jgi:hypothetical protein